MNQAFETNEPYKIVYKASATLAEFHANRLDTYRLVIGPVGSGKSVGMIQELQMLAEEQTPQSDGVRRTRSVIVRNTKQQLKDTTINTFMDWLPDVLCHWSGENCTVKYNLPDGSTVEWQVLFRALDKPSDVGRLLSLECSNFFFNESREIPFGIIETAETRIGRYPAKKDGGCDHPCMILDTNGPDDDSKIYHIFEELRPEGYKVYHQPSGLSPEAENFSNLPDGYYDRLQRGKSQDWIDVYLHGKYGFVAEGLPMYPSYNDLVHCTAAEIPFDRTKPLYLGMDFGLTPACVFIQLHAGGAQACIIDEYVTEDMDAVGFSNNVLRKIRKEYAGARVLGWGDPAGNERSVIKKNETYFNILNDMGLPIEEAPSQDPVLRHGVVNKRLRTLTHMGEPAVLISPKAKVLRKGMRGGYHRRRIQASGADRYMDKPNKNMYSHVCEGLEYALLGLGEGDTLVEEEVVQRTSGARRNSAPSVRRSIPNGL